MSIKSVLILDDEQNSLDLLHQLLSSTIDAKFYCTKYPTQAIHAASEKSFDIMLLDVTLHYRGTQYGGLEVYRSLMHRYGDSSIIAYSQYIDDDLLQKFGMPFNFIESHTEHKRWIGDLVSHMRLLRDRQTCFVAMPFGDRFDSLFSVIRLCVEENNRYRCVRIDQRAFTKSIVETIFEEIRKARFIIFVASEQNANVFYEAGYAVALDKEVITIVDDFHNLPFDVRDRNALRYMDLITFKSQLDERIRSLTLID